MRFSALVYWFFGAFAVLVGLWYLYRFDLPSGFALVFHDDLHDAIELPLPETNYLLPIQPFSAIILGVFLIFLERKFGWRAFPLLIMGAGIYDISSQWQLPVWTYRLWQGEFWAHLQLAELGIGYALAGFPRFKTAKYLLPLILAYVVFSSTIYYYVFIVALYLYILKCSQPRSYHAVWKWLTRATSS
jgi:hypothetical protein